MATTTISIDSSGETDVGTEKRQVDIDERAMVMAMLESTCGCNKGLSSQPCSTQFSADHLMSVRSSCSEISCSELDMVVMNQLMTGMDDTSTTNPHSRNKEKPRQRAAYSLYHQGKQVWDKMFRFLHTSVTPGTRTSRRVYSHTE